MRTGQSCGSLLFTSTIRLSYKIQVVTFRFIKLHNYCRIAPVRPIENIEINKLSFKGTCVENFRFFPKFLACAIENESFY